MYYNAGMQPKNNNNNNNNNKDNNKNMWSPIKFILLTTKCDWIYRMELNEYRE